MTKYKVYGFKREGSQPHCDKCVEIPTCFYVGDDELASVALNLMKSHFQEHQIDTEDACFEKDNDQEERVISDSMAEVLKMVGVKELEKT